MKNLLRTAVAAAAVLAALATGSAAQDFPSRPITVVVPVAAGGLSDVSARIIGEELGRRLRTPVVVENRTGAYGIAGAQAVTSARPDGYTLFYAHPGPLTVNPFVVKDLPYDPVRDLEPIGLAASFAMVLAVHPSVPAANVQEFVAYAKSRPGALDYASGGVGGTSHLAMELLKQRTAIDIQHIPFRGGTPAMNDLLAGRVSCMFNSPFQIMPYVREGRLRVLGSTAARPSELAAGVPPLAASGVPGLADYDVASWYGLLAPAGTPKPVIDRLSAALREALDDPALKRRLLESGAEPTPSDPQGLRDLIQKDMAVYRKLIEEAGIRM